MQLLQGLRNIVLKAKLGKWLGILGIGYILSL